MVIAFPGSDVAGSKPEIAVLATLLGGHSTIKWTPGFSLLSKAAAGTPGLSVSAANLGYSDAGLLTIQLNGPAASIRKGAESVVAALKSVADGSVSKDDVTKAVANAKFEALEKGQLRDSSVLLAGSGVVNGGKAVDIASVTKAFDGVNAEKLKTVSLNAFDSNTRYVLMADTTTRLPRLCSRARPLFLPLVISLSSLTPRILAFAYKWICYSAQACTNSQGGLDDGGCCFIVNICSRNPICSEIVYSPRC